MMLAIPLGRFPKAKKSMTRGNAGQMSRFFRRTCESAVVLGCKDVVGSAVEVNQTQQFTIVGTRGLEYAIHLHQHQVNPHKS